MDIGTPQIGMDLMRGYYRAGLVLAAFTLSAPALAGDGKPTRTVNVIHMSAPAPPKPDDQGNHASEQNDGSGFRLLDLARNKVSEAMRESFGDVALGSVIGSDLAEGEGRRAAVSRYSDIAVPNWMRAPILSVLPATDAFMPGCMAMPYRPSGFLPIHIEARRRTAYDAMSAAACEAGIPVGLFDALIVRESAYNTGAVSPKNAYGLAQLMPATAAGLGVDRFDPIQNLKGGARYLRAQLDRFGKVHLALAAYNAGPGRVKGGRIPPIAETQNYVRNVLDKWARLVGHHEVVMVADFAGPRAVSTTHAKPVREASIQVF